jgi:2,3-bisphosphoglycerate-independent phosphoglycerate mutase
MKPVVLIILDGWGYSPERRGNAIAQAHAPTFDMLEHTFPFGYLQASGIAVGLPWQEPGNSEVGHLTLGAGRVIEQALPRINRSIRDRSFFSNPALTKAIHHTQERGSTLHIAGLFGSGSVHSYLDHLHALLEFATQHQAPKVFLHLFLDGRDSPPKEGAGLLQHLIEQLKKTGEGSVATVVGRHFALDRTFQWARTEKAFKLIIEGTGERTRDPVAAITNYYAQGVTDEFMEPIIVEQPDGSVPTVREGDAIIFFEFREDSARQLTYAFVSPERASGITLRPPKDIFVATMTQYEKGLPVEVAFPPITVAGTLSEAISAAELKQLKIAESEKYAHATYFFNGGREEPFPGEDRKLIPSLEVSSFLEAPQMKAADIRDTTLRALEEKTYAFVMINLANADMLGHTGNLDATIQAVETIDRVVSSLIDAVLLRDGALVITADHGNAEVMTNLITGATVTEHSTNPVPFYLVAKPLRRLLNDAQVHEVKQRAQGVLSDIAPTVLNLLDVPTPPVMEGTSLLGLQ